MKLKPWLSVGMACLLAACASSPFEKREFVTQADVTRAEAVLVDSHQRYMRGMPVVPDGGSLGISYRRDPLTGLVTFLALSKPGNFEGKILASLIVYPSDNAGRVDFSRPPISVASAASDPIGMVLVTALANLPATALNGSVAALLAKGCATCGGGGASNVVDVLSVSNADSLSLANARLQAAVPAAAGGRRK